VGLLVFVVLVSVIFGVPSYVIGRRLGVRDAWVAFIPIAGPTMVLLWFPAGFLTAVSKWTVGERLLLGDGRRFRILKIRTELCSRGSTPGSTASS
jgi:hypothetical protein